MAHATLVDGTHAENEGATLHQARDGEASKLDRRVVALDPVVGSHLAPAGRQTQAVGMREKTRFLLWKKNWKIGQPVHKIAQDGVSSVHSWLLPGDDDVIFIRIQAAYIQGGTGGSFHLSISIWQEWKGHQGQETQARKFPNDHLKLVVSF